MDSKDKGQVNKSFKRFITAFERSNGVTCDWGSKFCEQFKGKKIGGVFGIVEEEYNGQVKKRHKLRWFCEDDKAASADIPNPKLLSGGSTSPAFDPTNIHDVSTDEVPF
jgi:hypothetical protein